tara:strand:+ start:95 stop:415 length:321 start_codon:yes stop_codon:yes gene_type:complete
MVRVRYTLGMARLYGMEFAPMTWYEVSPAILNKIKNADGWETESLLIEEPVAEVVEEVEETEEVAEEEVSVDLGSLTKKELQTLCKERDIEFKSFDSKTTLLSLLE